MVDGYTVEEAASVLGVPRERVWELLARGILTGSTDLGGGMRVRLKADRPLDPLAAPLDRPTDVPPPSTDLTPFRELLTEFRSLTERYGQALLALGEARGEVAGLRSRVDMLEARVDLRLPSAAGPISSSWAASPWPTPNERVADAPARGGTTAAPSASTPPESGDTDASSTDHADERASHKRRGRSGRRATESFADALARAEDPSTPELPGAAETAAALVGLRHDQPQDAGASDEDDSQADADYSLPRELPAADAVPVAEEEVAGETGSAATVDRIEIAEDRIPSRADDEIPQQEPSPFASQPAEPPEAVIAAEPAAASDAEVARELVSAEPPEEPADDPAPDLDAELASAPVSAAEPTEPAEESAAEPTEPISERPASTEPDPDREPGWDADRYSAAIEEPGWISADDVAVPPTAWEPPVRSAGTPAPASGQSGSMELSGSPELDEALAALDALAHPAPPIPETTGGRDDDVAGVRQGETAGRSVPAPAPAAYAPWVRPTPPPPLAVRSPASRAYRRLKRIFPS